MKECHLQQHGWTKRLSHSVTSVRQKNEYHMVLLTCGILKKKDTNELTYKPEIDR